MCFKREEKENFNMDTKPKPIHGFPIDAWAKPADLSAMITDDLVQQLWQKMYHQPVIVRCSHCNSHNVISSPACIQCGAPLGDYRKMKK